MRILTPIFYIKVQRAANRFESGHFEKGCWTMNIKECKDEALKLIERYSVAGQTVALSYNGQSDYLLRMNGLINDAVMTIATLVSKIDAVYEVMQTADERDTWIEYTMPDDFYQKSEAGAVYLDGEKLSPGTEYRWRTGTKFDVKSGLSGQLSVPYYRYPTEVESTTPDTAELDNAKETHIAVPYYVASMLMQQDNPYLAATLYNVYETKISRFNDGVVVTIDGVEDAYGFWG